MKDKHIYQALKYLYDNNADENITEEKLKAAISDTYPKEYEELRNGLILEGFISHTSNNAQFKITQKGINYLIENPEKIKRDIDIIKIFTIIASIAAVASVIIAIFQLYYQLHPSEKATYTIITIADKIPIILKHNKILAVMPSFQTFIKESSIEPIFSHF